jgi:cbb3-type cytochrome oxidase maturation protein
VDVLIYLIPAALFLGLLGLVCFVWALRSGQFDDLDGAAHRILFDQDPESDRTAPGETPAPSRRDTDPAG